MLGLDLDLEADLSIDSIKRMEIIADLKNKIGFGENLEQADDVMEKLAAIKTLRGLASWISEMSGETNETKNEVKEVDTPEAANNVLSRLRFDITPTDASSVQNTDVLQGKRFAITQDDQQTSAIKAELEKHGAIVELVDANKDLSNVDGLIMLDLFSATDKPSIIDHVDLIKKP